MGQRFFSVCWEWDRVPCNWESSAVLFQFGNNLKEHELDKLRKFSLNKHFIQSFVNYYHSFHLVLCNLCIAHSIFVSFNFGSLQQIDNFWSPFEKRILFGIGTGSL